MFSIFKLKHSHQSHVERFDIKEVRGCLIVCWNASHSQSVVLSYKLYIHFYLDSVIFQNCKNVKSIGMDMLASFLKDERIYFLFKNYFTSIIFLQKNKFLEFFVNFFELWDIVLFIFVCSSFK